MSAGDTDSSDTAKSLVAVVTDLCTALDGLDMADSFRLHSLDVSQGLTMKPPSEQPFAAGCSPLGNRDCVLDSRLQGTHFLETQARAKVHRKARFISAPKSAAHLEQCCTSPFLWQRAAERVIAEVDGFEAGQLREDCGQHACQVAACECEVLDGGRQDRGSVCSGSHVDHLKRKGASVRRAGGIRIEDQDPGNQLKGKGA